MSAAWIAALVVPAVVAWAAIALLANSRLARPLSDHPNERSLHVRPRARVGGLGVMAGALPVAAYLAGDTLGGVLACAAALALVSLLDDVHSLPIQVRLPAHVVAAAVAVLAMGAPHWGVVPAAIGVLAIAWMTNLFNFMDGADGLAGGMAAIGFAALAIGAQLAGETGLALACAALASASVGFLVHNFPPARVFLGDAGSIPLGFLAGALGIHGATRGAWPPWFALLVFSPFIVDASFTLARRLWRREAVWRAHREHLYQRLVLAGWSHRKLAMWAYGLMTATAASALAGRGSGVMLQCGIILAWIAAYLLLGIAIGRYLRRAGGVPGGSPERSIG